MSTRSTLTAALVGGLVVASPLAVPSGASAKARQCKSVDKGTKAVFRADKIRASGRITCHEARDTVSLATRGFAPGDNAGKSNPGGYSCGWQGLLNVPVTNVRCYPLKSGTVDTPDKKHGSISFRMILKPA